MLKTKKKIIVYTSLLGIIICILSFIVYAKITEGMVRSCKEITEPFHVSFSGRIA